MSVPIPRTSGMVGKMSEGHLINYFDRVGDIPEYEPLSYEIMYINPMVKNFTYSDGKIVQNNQIPPKFDLV